MKEEHDREHDTGPTGKAGESLGCGAAMTALRRTRTGSFEISAAKTLEEIADAASAGDLFHLLITVDTLFDEYPKTIVDADGEKLCRCGALIPAVIEHTETPYRVYGPYGEFLMLGKTIEINGKTFLKTVKNFFDVG
jgi:tRNA pseudouridine55 synthase